MNIAYAAAIGPFIITTNGIDFSLSYLVDGYTARIELVIALCKY